METKTVYFDIETSWNLSQEEAAEVEASVTHPEKHEQAGDDREMGEGQEARAGR